MTTLIKSKEKFIFRDAAFVLEKGDNVIAGTVPADVLEYCKDLVTAGIVEIVELADQATAKDDPPADAPTTPTPDAPTTAPEGVGSVVAPDAGGEAPPKRKGR